MSEKNDVNQSVLNKESVDEKTNKENLPVVQKGRLAMLTDNLRNNPKTADTLRRIGKIVGYGSISLGSFASIFIAPITLGAGTLSTLGSVIAAGAALSSAIPAAFHIMGRNDKDMMFTIKNDGVIGQTWRPDLIYKIRGLTNNQRSGYIGLQLLTALSREKIGLQNSDISGELEDNTKIYSKQYTTNTHPMIVRMFKQLDRLGYIKIDSCAPILDKNGNKKTSNLLVEKILIGNKKEKKKNQIQAQTQDRPQTTKTKKKSNPLVMHKIEFKVTDKGLDLANLFQKCNDPEFMSKPENEAYKSFFSSILSVTSPTSPFCPTRDEEGNQEKVSVRIDIGKDRFGRDIIIYRSMSDSTKTCSEILLESRQKISDEAKSKTQEEPIKDEPTKTEVDKEEIPKAKQTQIETNGKDNEQGDSFTARLKVGFTPTVPEHLKRTNNESHVVKRNSQEVDTERE